MTTTLVIWLLIVFQPLHEGPRMEVKKVYSDYLFCHADAEKEVREGKQWSMAICTTATIDHLFLSPRPR